MKRSNLIRLASASCILAFAGCLTNTDNTANNATQDGGNVVLTQETRTMASTLDNTDSTAVVNDTLTNVVTLEKIIVPLHLDSTCGCFVRSSSFTNTTKGFERSRADSIWLFSAGVALTDSFAPKNADSIVHVRHVTRVDGYSGKNTDFTMTTTLVRRSTDSGTVFVWTGSVSGVFKGQAITAGTFNMLRPFSMDHGFGKPHGRMSMKRGRHDVAMEFGADGTVTATAKRNGRLEGVSRIDDDDDEHEVETED
jgi:hypothetical protein